MTYQEYLDKLLAAEDKSEQEDILWRAVLDVSLDGNEFVRLVNRVFPEGLDDPGRAGSASPTQPRDCNKGGCT